MSPKTESKTGFAWVSDEAPSDQNLLATAATEFGLTLRFCGCHDALDVLRDERCQLAVVELDGDRGGALRLLKQIRERLPRTSLVAASGDGSVATIRSALQAGASEFLSLPLNAQELNKTLVKLTQVGPSASVGPAVAGEVLTLYGARGGLGVTTLAVNLAVRLASRDSGDVALVDLDLQRGDVSAFLNLTPLQSLATIAEAGSEVDEIFLHGTMTRHPSGVFILPAPPQIEDADAVGHDEVARTLGLLRSQFRYTVVDTSRTITGAIVAGLESADRVLLLTDLTVPGVRAAQRAIELFGRLNLPASRVALLVTETVPGPVTLKDAIRTIGKEPLLILPRDEAAANDAMNAGTPLNGAHSGLSLAVSELTAKVAGVGAQARARRGHFLQRMFSKG